MYDFWNPANADPSESVGSRHHIVPATYLRGFSNPKGQVLVFDRRGSGKPHLARVEDIGVKNFYTFTNVDGKPDGRFEQLLSKIESKATRFIRRATSPILSASPLTMDERESLCLFIAFQVARSVRMRREIEITGDLGQRLQLLGLSGSTEYQHPDSGEIFDLGEISFVPDPNEHISMVGKLAERMFECLIDRPVSYFDLQGSTLLTCDEPVLRERNEEDDGQPHRPHGAEPSSDYVHLRSTSRGVADTEEIVLPLSRRWVVALGPRGGHQPRSPLLHVDPEQSRQIASEINDAIVDRAYLAVFAHPDDTHLLPAKLPSDSRNAFHICGVPEHYVRNIERLSAYRHVRVYGRD